jgi:uroporphyrinogen-III synthase
VKLLVLRPQPGAAGTARRALQKGLEPVEAPLFVIRPLDWRGPDADEVEAVLLTSANAARHGGSRLEAYISLPCYAVGEATATAAREAGFTDVRVGDNDAVEIVDRLIRDGIIQALHLCGRDHVEIEHPGVTLTRRCVYAAEAVPELPLTAAETLREDALVLLHSPRAGRRFGQLVDQAGLARDRIGIAAISEAAAAAAGDGWKRRETAPRPSDDALLELAASMCQTGS